eukprot:gene17180-23496_t
MGPSVAFSCRNELDHAYMAVASMLLAVHDRAKSISYLEFSTAEVYRPMILVHLARLSSSPVATCQRGNEVLRFLKARNGDVAAARKMFLSCMLWRDKWGADNILQAAIITVQHSTYFRSWILLMDCPRRDLYEYIMQVALPSCGQLAGKQVGQVTTIVDLQGMGLCCRFIQQSNLFEVFFSSNHKATVEKAGFASAFEAVKRFLSPDTQKKIQILGKSYLPALTKIVSPENLMVQLGGRSLGTFADNAGPWLDYQPLQHSESNTSAVCSSHLQGGEASCFVGAASDSCITHQQQGSKSFIGSGGKWKASLSADNLVSQTDTAAVFRKSSNSTPLLHLAQAGMPPRPHVPGCESSATTVHHGMPPRKPGHGASLPSPRGRYGSASENMQVGGHGPTLLPKGRDGTPAEQHGPGAHQAAREAGASSSKKASTGRDGKATDQHGLGAPQAALVPGASSSKKASTARDATPTEQHGQGAHQAAPGGLGALVLEEMAEEFYSPRTRCWTPSPLPSASIRGGKRVQAPWSSFQSQAPSASSQSQLPSASIQSTTHHRHHPPPSTHHPPPQAPSASSQSQLPSASIQSTSLSRFGPAPADLTLASVSSFYSAQESLPHQDDQRTSDQRTSIDQQRQSRGSHAQRYHAAQSSLDEHELSRGRVHATRTDMPHSTCVDSDEEDKDAHDGHAWSSIQHTPSMQHTQISIQHAQSIQHTQSMPAQLVNTPSGLWSWIKTSSWIRQLKSQEGDEEVGGDQVNTGGQGRGGRPSVNIDRDPGGAQSSSIQEGDKEGPTKVSAAHQLELGSQRAEIRQHRSAAHHVELGSKRAEIHTNRSSAHPVRNSANSAGDSLTQQSDSAVLGDVVWVEDRSVSGSRDQGKKSFHKKFHALKSLVGEKLSQGSPADIGSADARSRTRDQPVETFDNSQVMQRGPDASSAGEIWHGLDNRSSRTSERSSREAGRGRLGQAVSQRSSLKAFRQGSASRKSRRALSALGPEARISLLNSSPGDGSDGPYHGHAPEGDAANCCTVS